MNKNNEKKTYISLGWKCDSSVIINQKHSLQKTQHNVNVFDSMISNLHGIIKCFENDFQYFCDPKYLIYNGKGYIKNSFYKFMFNFETPGHADLYLKEGWPGNDKFYFTKNNFKMFIERYQKRILNFKTQINNNDQIIFVLQMVRINQQHPLLLEFKKVLNKKYPKKTFSFDLIEEENVDFYKNHLLTMGLHKDLIDLHLSINIKLNDNKLIINDNKLIINNNKLIINNIVKDIKKTYISIGWRCESAVRRTRIYGLKKPEYQTCVFDLMVSNLNGVIKCFENDFQYFCDPKYLIYNGKDYIKNTYYNFMFNHETPGHADLHLKEGWPGNDKFYFTKNNFKMFIDRYYRRISNLKNYILNNDHIIFILQMVKINQEQPLLLKFKKVLNKKYPEKIFSFDLYEEPKVDFYKNNLISMGLKNDLVDLHLK
jgi:hypothetical protein